MFYTLKYPTKKRKERKKKTYHSGPLESVALESVDVRLFNLILPLLYSFYFEIKFTYFNKVCHSYTNTHTFFHLPQTQLMFNSEK